MKWVVDGRSWNVPLGSGMVYVGCESVLYLVVVRKNVCL